ncbi:methyltransferase domain-containing protein [Danxiaibacter flavus]|uniref:Methyltransferase domain-containing protein n=1 Tax=Danxiaibacter flavus TaxID=3049108 RepID=A0ABV3ZFQ7_9BACT|nr:methyltransferase domain-containing protein [Chitinophagaceae bacterium DXS]
MSKFAQRSGQTELIDEPGIPFSDWAVCLRELNTINTWLGGHAITLAGVKKLLHLSTTPVRIAEIGCGGGDNLRAIHNWNNRSTYAISYTGIDLNKACVEFAEQQCSDLPGKVFINSDYRQVKFEKNEKPSIIFNSLFCHHFTNEQLIEMLGWMKSNATIGFFINDLQRHPVAYYSIKWLTALFSRSYLVKHDAPVSVIRGFSRQEWRQLLKLAGISNYTIQWRWAFRYLITVRV